MNASNKTNELVTVSFGKATTTSLLIAEKFGKEHSYVLRAIKKITSTAGFNEGFFAVVNYIDSRGAKRPMYSVTRDGFSLLAMGFTGKKALNWKVAYLKAFNAMELALARQGQVIWKQAREDCKTARRMETDTIRLFVDYAVSQGSLNAQKYYMNITSMTYKNLFFLSSVSAPVRDILDTMQLAYLTVAEHVVDDALKEGMTQGLHYKEVYKFARERLVSYASLVGQTALLNGPQVS